MSRLNPKASKSCMLLSLFGLIASVSSAQTPQPKGLPTWTISAGYTQYVAAPLDILEINGPARMFIPKWQRSSGLDLYVGRAIGTHGRLLFRGTWDRVPLAYETDVQPSDYPGLGLSYPVESLNLSFSVERVSLGLGYRFGWDLSGKDRIDLGLTILRRIGRNDYPLNIGEGAATDTSTVQIAELETQVFPGNSLWHVRPEIQYTRRVYKEHALSLSYYVDVPFSDIYTNGRAILLGDSQYRTTLTFRQSGFIQGLTIGYTYGWTRDLKRAAERQRKHSSGS